MSNGLKNVRIEYSNAVTINTGNFQNVRPGYALSADVEEGVHPNEARARLEALVDGWLEEKVEKFNAELEG
jgi:hypothetical protein